jgi:hypothetical protein
MSAKSRGVERRENAMFFKDSKLRKLPCFMVLGVDFFIKKGGPIQGLNGAAQ